MQVMLILFWKCNECDAGKRSEVKDVCIDVEELCLFACILVKSTQVHRKSRRIVAGQSVKFLIKYKNV